MRLTEEEFIKAIDKYSDMEDMNSHITHSLGVVEWEPNEWLTEYLNLFKQQCDLKGFLKDDTCGDIIDWFIFETEYGRREDLNTIIVYDNEFDSETTWVIDSAAALYGYITFYPEGE